jgi:hypothetical protein
MGCDLNIAGGVRPPVDHRVAWAAGARPATGAAERSQSAEGVQIRLLLSKIQLSPVIADQDAIHLVICPQMRAPHQRRPPGSLAKARGARRSPAAKPRPGTADPAAVPGRLCRSVPDLWYQPQHGHLWLRNGGRVSPLRRAAGADPLAQGCCRAAPGGTSAAEESDGVSHRP